MRKFNDNFLLFMSLICSWTPPYFILYNLSFNQYLDIITHWTQKELNAAFKAKLLFVINVGKTRKQNVFNHHTKNIGLFMAQYKLENNFGLISSSFMLPMILRN